MSQRIMDLWVDDLSYALVDHLTPETVASVAAEASSVAAGIAMGSSISTLATASGTGITGGGATVAGLSTAAKVSVATVAVAVGAGIAAVSGTLPEPLQTWVADVVETIGIDLPSPADPALPTVPIEEISIPDAPVGELPDAPLDQLPDVTFPDPTTPDVTVPDVTIPTLPASDRLTIPDLP
jgi:hypothetical protein